MMTLIIKWGNSKLVDIYNSISLKYALPCGGEDIDKFAGNIKLTAAVGNEEFIPLGTDENPPHMKEKLSTRMIRVQFADVGTGGKQ